MEVRRVNRPRVNYLGSPEKLYEANQEDGVPKSEENKGELPRQS
jgi:hypothetical protein